MGPGSWSEFGLAESYFYHNLVLSPKPGIFNLFFKPFFFFFCTFPPQEDLVWIHTFFFNCKTFMHAVFLSQHNCPVLTPLEVKPQGIPRGPLLGHLCGSISYSGASAVCFFCVVDAIPVGALLFCIKQGLHVRFTWSCR